MEDVIEVDRMIDELIEREGGFVNNPADKGGPTCFGITEAVARANGYAGPMRLLPREEAAEIYKRLYWLRPRFDEIAARSPRLAAELFDTGVNMGPAVAATFLQRALTALNRGGTDYPDLVPDGRIGPMTLFALDAFLAACRQIHGCPGARNARHRQQEARVDAVIAGLDALAGQYAGVGPVLRALGPVAGLQYLDDAADDRLRLVRHLAGPGDGASLDAFSAARAGVDHLVDAGGKRGFEGGSHGTRIVLPAFGATGRQ